MKKHPAILFAVFFVLGIFLQKQFMLPLSVLAAAVLLLSLLSFFLLKSAKLLFIKELIPFLLILVLGTSYLAFYNMGKTSYPFDHARMKNVTLYGQISGLELFREYEIRFRLETDSSDIDKNINSKGLTFLCRIRFKDKSALDSLYRIIADGNYICAKGVISKGKEKRNPFEFDYQKYLENSGITGLFTVSKPEDFSILNADKSFFSNTILNVRKSLDETITKLHAPQSAALLKGLLIGDRSEISEDINNQFINSGVMHVIAISGQHVAYILIIFILLFGRFNIYVRSAFTIAGLFFFLFITGSSPSVFRAVVMAMVIIAGYLTNRSVNGFNALAVSAIILLLIDPNTLFDPGFQLSYSAVLGMMTFGSFFYEKVYRMNLRSRLLRGALLLILVSFAAQIGTLPFSLYYFGKLSIVGFAANLIIVPVSGIIISIGIFTLVLSPFWFWGAQIYALVNDWLIFFTLKLVKIFGEWKYSFLAVNQFTLFDLLVSFFFIGILLFYYKKLFNKTAKVLFIILLAANIYVFTALDKIDYLPANKLSVMMIDVGQGDSFLIKFPNGQTALVDAGDASEYFDNGEHVILPLTEKLGIEKIDYAFLSHPESDHYGGYISLIKRGKIERLYKPPCDSSVKSDLLFEKFCEKYKITVNHYNSIPLSIGNSRVYFLNSTSVIQKLKSNDRSGVVMIKYGGTSVLFTGDIEKSREDELVKYYGSFLKADVLKIPHHGSRTSSTYAFLKTVSPQYALISAGIENKFNHPSPETIEKLEQMKTDILCTKNIGGAIIYSDGLNIQIQGTTIFFSGKR